MMSDFYVMDENGDPIPADLFSSAASLGQVVDRTDMVIEGEEVTISTVFLGIDHGFGGTPLLYETMIFGGKYDEWQKRYSTFADAEVTHSEIVENLKQGKEPW